jgi:cardiolipin synthase
MTLTLQDGWYPIIVFIAYILVIVLIGGRVLIRKKPIGVTLSWILLIIVLPVVGVGLYLLFGESYVGFYRARRAKYAFQRFVETVSTDLQHPLVIPQQFDDPASPLWDQTFGAMKLPAVRGNSVSLLPDADSALAQLLHDIDQAVNSIHMEFYICQLGGRVDGIFAALAKAVSRGVDVRVMCDSVGSGQFLRSDALDSLRAKGIRIEEALHANLFRVLLRRQDLRMHRKIIVVDRWISYTGSMNLVDPVLFNKDAGVGQWIDLMVRVVGPVSVPMKAILDYDWYMETHEEVSHTALPTKLEVDPGVPIQMVPSGPAIAKENLLNLLLTAIYSARTTLDITTPYFVPDDAILTALKSAAQRGVKVRIFLPINNDSFLAKHAGRSFFDELLVSGVHIFPFKKGLLHTKCVLVDNRVALVGSVNLDMRSIWLNFEITAVISDAMLCQSLASVIQGYQLVSDKLDLQRWRSRSLARRILENATRLLSPLL